MISKSSSQQSRILSRVLVEAIVKWGMLKRAELNYQVRGHRKVQTERKGAQVTARSINMQLVDSSYPCKARKPFVPVSLV